VRAACLQQGPVYILDVYPKGDLYIHKNIQTHKHTHTHEHIHARTHTQTHTHAHTQTTCERRVCNRDLFTYTAVYPDRDLEKYLDLYPNRDLYIYVHRFNDDM